jgi:hypothetical protein
MLVKRGHDRIAARKNIVTAGPGGSLAAPAAAFADEGRGVT